MVSDSTKSSYINMIKRLKIDTMTESQILVHIKKKYKNIGTRNNYLKAVVFHFNCLKKPHVLISQCISRNSIQLRQQQELQIKHKKYQNWDDVIKNLTKPVDIYDEIIIELYSNMAPRRIQDILDIQWQSNPGNYITPYHIVLNQHKMSWRYGVHILNMTEKLQLLIEQLSQSKNSAYVFSIKGQRISYSQFSNRILRLFGFRINQLRHSYATSICEHANIRERKRLAYNMGHSINTQELYYIKK